MRLAVDATDLDHRIYRIRQSIPVATSGPMVLLYPRWIPGTHSPDGPLYNYAGLRMTAGGRELRWTRDTIDVYAFHVNVPPGAPAIDIEAQYLTPVETNQGGASITREMLRLNWFVATLYPAGYFARQIAVDASVTLPADWSFATALEVVSAAPPTVSFKTVSFETLLDSPLIAGKYFKKIDLDTNGRSRVTLNVMADTPAQLEAPAKVIDIHQIGRAHV